MSYKIANDNDVVVASGPLSPRLFPSATITLLNPSLENSGYTSGQKFTIGSRTSVGSIKVFSLLNDPNICILYDEYKHDSEVPIYTITGTTLEKLCEGVIKFSSESISKMPTKDEIMMKYNCIVDSSLTGRSDDYVDESLVRVEDLREPEDSGDSTSVKIKFNSKYITIAGVNRGILPIISAADSELSEPHGDPISLNPYIQISQCNSEIECRLGDTIEIYTNADSYLEAVLYEIGYQDNGYINFLPYYGVSDILHKKYVKLTISEEILQTASEYYVFIYCTEYENKVSGHIVNPKEVLADGVTYPSYDLTISYAPTFDGYNIFQYNHGNIQSYNSYPVVYNTDVQASWYVYNHNDTMLINGYFVTIVTDDGEIIQNEYTTNTYTSFTMPKKGVRISIRVDSQDNSIAFSSSLYLFAENFLSRNKDIPMFSKAQLSYDLDTVSETVQGEFLKGLTTEMSKITTVKDGYYFPIEISAAKMFESQPTMKVTVRLKLSDSFTDKLSSMVFDLSKINGEVTIHDECVSLQGLASGNTTEGVLKKSGSEEWDFIFDVILENNKVIPLCTICFGEPIRIKVTDNIYCSAYSSDWIIEDGAKFNMMERGITRDFVTMVYEDDDFMFSYTPRYICIFPASHIRTIPEYYTEWVNFFKRDVINHPFGCTHENDVALNSELLLPSTVTSLDIQALPYMGFYKVEVPNLQGSIPERCFKCCWYLREFKVPDGVHTIEERAFGGAGTGSWIPFNIDLNKTETIKEGAFADAFITELTIPSTVINLQTPMWSFGLLSETCFIQKLIWDKIDETRILSDIFPRKILDKLKTLVIGPNVNTLPDGFLLLKNDLNIEYYGTVEEWKSKFGKRLTKQYYIDPVDVYVKCSDGSFNYKLT